jgi:hypothetical protein
VIIVLDINYCIDKIEHCKKALVNGYGWTQDFSVYEMECVLEYLRKYQEVVNKQKENVWKR